jgi:16S rRNA (guanine(966)-N(2))-methyltransferase RsmD
MRIISGRLKGRILKLPRGIRATSDKVRKALFDILGERVVNSEVLDLFAGSGSLGIEALSRGAKSVIFVEKDRRCLEKIKENLSVIGLLPARRLPASKAGTSRGYRVMELDIFEAIKKLNRKTEKFDIIFLDPPYYKGMAKKSLQTLFQYDILKPNGLIVAEHYKKDELPQTLGELALARQERYGDTVLSFYSVTEV